MENCINPPAFVASDFICHGHGYGNHTLLKINTPEPEWWDMARLVQDKRRFRPKGKPADVYANTLAWLLSPQRDCRAHIRADYCHSFKVCKDGSEARSEVIHRVKSGQHHGGGRQKHAEEPHMVPTTVRGLQSLMPKTESSTP
ncbi:hypothetical protein PO909_009671 [Leuciscus waleckii]